MASAETACLQQAGEYYERCDIPQTIKEHNTDLKRRQNTYNTVRLHQALGYRTPPS